MMEPNTDHRVLVRALSRRRSSFVADSSTFAAGREGAPWADCADPNPLAGEERYAQGRIGFRRIQRLRQTIATC